MTAWTKKDFEQKLRDKGKYYHIHHPFHVAMNRGNCSREQIQGWVANRFYYQVTIPNKDAAIMSNCTDRDVRREWVQRILDHDGVDGEDGGIEAWLRLAEAVGMTRAQIISHEFVLPGVRFACDAYLNFARRATWQEAACSSLTELFAPEIHQSRLDSWPTHSHGLKLRVTNIFVSGSRKLVAMYNMVSILRWSTSRPGSNKNMHWVSCSSNLTCSGRCSTRCS